MLYLFTDGYADQFGGADEKKFKTINIRRLLSDIYSHPEDDQKRLLEKAIRNWMGRRPQIDDILIVGTKCRDPQPGRALNFRFLRSPSGLHASRCSSLIAGITSRASSDYLPYILMLKPHEMAL
ncbi:MAG: hypothetical protein MZW92_68465 [Comamonadaceae bacterium]|nr:hypothetical protein [Comamonadaceae bacterium]